MNKDESDDRRYVVLINHEHQYSLWLAELAVPKGWKAVGKEGSLVECSQYVDEVWTDITPLSVRNKLRAAAEPL